MCIGRFLRLRTLESFFKTPGAPLRVPFDVLVDTREEISCRGVVDGFESEQSPSVGESMPVLEAGNLRSTS
jgi:hypothetical protein